MKISPRPRKRIKVPTPDYLANVALHYLSRFAASEASLRRVLENRVRRAKRTHESLAADAARLEELHRAIGAIIEKHKKSGVLNDAAYAVMKVNSLRRAGRGARRIAQQLQQKGVATDIIASALAAGDGEAPDGAERAAALVFARRRGLGPFRKTQKVMPENMRQKDYAAMARAGFSYDISRDVLGGEAEENE
jgi:regulatory protein